MKGSTFSTIALLAGLMLASSCNLTHSNRWQKIELRSNRKFSVQVVQSNISREKHAPHTPIILYDHDPKEGTVVFDNTVNVLGATAIHFLDNQDIYGATNYLSNIKSVLKINHDRIYHITHPAIRQSFISSY